ncbi:MAG: transposase, partial [Bacteroidales bacterium]
FIADHLGIDTLVAIPANSRSSEAPDPNYNVEHFQFDKEKDCYLCPQGHELHSNGTWYKAANYRFRQFKTKACKDCPVKEKCTASKRNGKIVQRSEYTESLERNKQRVDKNKELYRKRQAIVEHPFGTIKRQWGFSYILTKKTKERASADTGFMMIAYNLKRIINIIDIKAFREYLEAIYSVLNPFFGFFRLFIASLRFFYQNIMIEHIFILPLQNKPKSANLKHLAVVFRRTAVGNNWLRLYLWQPHFLNVGGASPVT